MSKEIKITLYYANWCGHCTNFKPEWNNFKENISEMKGGKVKVSVKEYEHSELETKGGAKINGKDIDGYPTIKIKLIKGKESNEYDYGDYGLRDSKYMTEFIKNVVKLM